MADGRITPIAEVEVGDWVLAADPESGERGPRQVTAVWVHQDQLVDLELDGGVVTTTEDHPFWNASDRQWQRADELDAGEMVLTADGDQVAIEGMDWATRTGGVASNLTVADLHTYFVVVGEENVLVHNTCQPNKGNFKRMSDRQIREEFGMTAHEFKREILGRNADISQYDIYRDRDHVYLVGKQSNVIIDTGYTLWEAST